MDKELILGGLHNLLEVHLNFFCLFQQIKVDSSSSSIKRLSCIPLIPKCSSLERSILCSQCQMPFENLKIRHRHTYHHAFSIFYVMLINS